MKNIYTLILTLSLVALCYQSAGAATNKANFAYGTLATAISNATVTGTFTITPNLKASAFPASNFLIVVYSPTCTMADTCSAREIMLISSRSGNVFTIGARNQEGTTHSATWPLNSNVDHTITSGTFSEYSTTVTGSNCFAGLNSSGTWSCYSSWDDDKSANHFIPMVITSISGTCNNNELASYSTGTSGLRIYICESGLWKLQGGGVASGSTGTIPGAVLVSGGTNTPVSASAHIIDPTTGVYRTGKASGIANWAWWENDYGSDVMGVGFEGPYSGATLTQSILYRFSATVPTAGQIWSFGTPTTAVRSLPTGTVIVDIIPLSFLTVTTGVGNPGSDSNIPTEKAVRSAVTAAGGMAYPPTGIGVSTGSAWGTSLSAPTGTIVGTTDTQTLTNKSIVTVEVDSHVTATLTTAQVSSTMLYNTGQSATASVTTGLPPAAAGYSFIAPLGTAMTGTYYWEVRADSADKIYFDGTAGTDGHTVRATAQAVGSYLVCFTFKTDAYDWACKTGSGTWTAQ